MADNTLLNAGTGGDTIRSIDHTGVKTQLVAVDFGGEAGPESIVTSTNAFPISINAANFIFSTGNTSTVQLNAGATFPGSVETALNQPCISLLMTCDQPMVLTIKQYIDAGGSFAVPDIAFSVPAGTQFSRSFVLNGNYVKVTAQNTGSSTTTTFNLNTAYGTISPADATGSVPVVVNQAANTSLVTSFSSTSSLPAGQNQIGSVNLNTSDVLLQMLASLRVIEILLSQQSQAVTDQPDSIRADVLLTFN
jgi:hypothetical protein